jgi:iron complex transport system substrate-binding protein
MKNKKTIARVGLNTTLASRRLAGAVCLAVAFGLLAVRAADAEIHVTDDTGAAVTLASPAQRIVSLAPHATELLFAAGAGGRIVGVMSGSDFPSAAGELPVVGTANALDLERILALRPDLIVTWPYTTPTQVDVLRGQGIPVFTTNPGTIDGIARDIERLGALADSSAIAREAAQRFGTRLAALAAHAAGKIVVRVFYQVSNVPLYTVGGNHLITHALTLCGAQNIFVSLTLPAPEISVEAVLAAHPDAIVAGTAAAVTPTWLAEWRRWRDMPAVRGNRLFVVDANLLHRPGPRFVDGVEQLCDVVERARDSM